MVACCLVLENTFAAYRVPIFVLPLEVGSLYCCPTFNQIVDKFYSTSSFVLLLSSRLFRYIPFFVKHPDLVWLVPFFLMYLYAHAFLKAYALFTLTNVRFKNLSSLAM